MTEAECKSRLVMMGWKIEPDGIFTKDSRNIYFSKDKPNTQIYDPYKAYENQHVFYRTYTTTIQWALIYDEE